MTVQKPPSMAKAPGSDIKSIEQLLDKLREADCVDGSVSWGAIMKLIGRRSFGPLLLVVGLVVVSPGIADIPGVSTMAGLLVLLIAGQFLIGREHIWQPKWLLKGQVKRTRIDTMIRWLRRPARWVDRLIKQRLTVFTEGVARYIIAAACIAIAAMLPLTEIVPFSGVIGGAALTAFALSLIAHDGLLALLAFILTAGCIGLVLWVIL